MKLRTDSFATEFPTLKRIPRGGDFPATMGQSGIWYVRQTEGVDYSYNEQMSLGIKGSLDVSRLERCFNRLIERHESLRTVFKLNDEGQLIQRIQDPYKIQVQTIDASDIGQDEKSLQEKIREVSLEQGQVPYDLETGPLLSVCLLQLPNREQRLFISFHRLAMDGTSCYNFINDWKEIDKAFEEGGEPNLPSLPVQPVDYAVWEQEYLKSAAAESAVEYWKQTLSEFPPLLDLPYDKPWNSDTPPVGAWEPVYLEKDLVERLSAVGKKHNASINVTLLAAFEVLLMRYTGQTDIVIGSHRANRNIPEIQQTIGHFDNTVLLRNTLSGHKPFSQLLKEVRVASIDASYQYNLPYLTLDEIAGEMGKPDDQPLYQVGVEYRPLPLRPYNIGSSEITDIEHHGIGSAKFDILLSLTQTNNGLTGHIEYNAELFKRITVLQIFSHFKQLLHSIVETPDADISSLDILAREEKQKILTDWNKTEVNYPAIPSVHKLFEAQAVSIPDAIAVVFEGQQLSYSHLNERSNQLAHYLIQQGVKPDTRVGLSVERSFELAIGILGILKAGGAYVPLDPAYPKERQAYMLEQADVDILVTQKSLSSQLPAQVMKLALDNCDEWASDDKSALQNPQPVVKPEHLAYVIFTSGSTGRPKAVAMPHVALINLIHWQVEHSVSTVGTRTLQFSPFSFDVSFQELFSTWASGGALVLTSEEVRKDPFSLWHLTRCQDVNRLFMPFIALQQLAEVYPDTIANDKGSDTRAKRYALQEIITAGEQLQITAPIRSLFQQLLDCRLYNHYGPSETHVCTALRLEDFPQEWEALPTIGKPIANDKVYLLDEFLQPVPLGVYGELYVGGVGLARGYLNNDDLTAERFIQNPFIDRSVSNKLNNRLYKTGDLARFRIDGCLEYKGRIDNQVKVRGFRVELGEIEQVLVQQKDIKEAVVTVHSRHSGTQGKYLVAYIVKEKSKKAQTNESQKNQWEPLRRALEAVLPDYMVPSVFISLDSLPLTPSGKIDRRGLPMPTAADLQLQAYVASRTETEKQLTAIWATALDFPVDQLSIEANFLTLGGDSLAATRVVSQIRQTMNVTLQIADILQADTLEALARKVEKAQQTANENNSVAIIPLTAVEHSEPMPLSFAQQRLWFLNQFEGGTDTRYNEVLALKLEGNLHVGALEIAFKAIVQRHSVLRTSFQMHNDEAVQIIVDHLNLAFPVITLCEENANEGLLQQSLQLASYVNQFANYIFDLSQGPLIKITLIRLSANQHVLLINMHHIICDGWSMEVLGHELSLFYQAYQQGKQASIPALPVQYIDFSCWQRKWLQGEILQQQLDYWKNQLNSAPALLELPTDRPRPAVLSYRGRRYAFNLPIELTESLRGLSQQTGATLFMTLLAGFSLLLSRYSGQRDICVGTPIANRQYEELESLIGFFVNTLVLRTQVNSQSTVTELLQLVKATAFSAFANQDVPFEQLVDVLKPERSLSFTPLFQVMFVLQDASEAAFNLPAIEMSSLVVETCQTKFDMTLFLTESRNGIVGTLEYSTDLFDETTIERFVKHYQILLEGMVRQPELEVGRLPLLSEAERQQILFDWNDTQVDYPKDKCIHRLFEEQAEKVPDAIAVVFEEQQLTYEELNKRSTQLAYYLIEQGVGPEIRVGICVERSLEMIIGLLGILKAGGAYVPLDPEYPLERLRYMLEDSESVLVLTQNRLLDKISEVVCDGVKSLVLDRDWPQIATADVLRCIRERVQSNELAYIIYTSGSTGKPKGVMIPHQALTNFLISMGQTPGLVRKDSLLAVTTFCFDIAGLEMYLPLIKGAKVCLCSSETGRDPDKLTCLIEQSKATIMQATPATWKMLFQVGWENRTGLRAFCGGEALSESLKQQFIDTDTEVWNLFGPTETTIWSTVCQIQAGQPITIGRPIANTQIYILDSQKKPVPIGVAGELCIAGDGLARGYLHKPEMTAEKFVDNPFITDKKLYRTGDLARWLPNGNIDYIGRLDYQVKVRGYRIELGEIENALMAHKDISEAVVITYSRNQTEDNILIAYVVSAHRQKVDSAQLKTELKDRLPEYMIPSLFMVLDQLPLTPNGKVDRKALPLPDENTLLTKAYIAPRTETEKVLVDIWADILSLPVDKVGIHDNFFDLGGHSLLATRVISQIRKIFSVELPIRELFTASTIQDLAVKVDEQMRHSPLMDKQEFPLIQIENRESLPLSFAQQRLWFLDQFESEQRIQYNVPWALRLEGHLDIGALQQAIKTLLQRHESLRTVFSTENEQTYQKVLNGRVLSLSTIDVQAGDLPTELAANVNHVFDLTQGPLFTVRLLRLSTQVHILLLNMHHIISDGWSMGVFNQELAALYTAYHQGRPSPLAPLPIQYADFAYWQRQWLQGEVLDKQVNYWKVRLEGAPALLELPTDRPRPATQSFRGSYVGFTLPVALTKELQQLSRQQGATLFMTLLAGFNLLLARYSGQDDICVGTPIANRQRAELENLMGFFVNTLVLRSRVEAGASVKDLLQQIKETALSAYAHQDIPFEQLVEALNPERSLSYSPLFQVMFVLQNNADDGMELPGITVSSVESPYQTAKFDLTLNLAETGKGLEGIVEYNTDLFDETTIERFAGHYRILLEGMTRQPEQVVGQLPLLSEAERQQILFDWNRTEVDYPKDKCIHQLFEEQVEKAPHAIAVVFEDQQLTYEELNKRSNQLAHYLIERGVAPEVRVGICVERSLEMIIGLLGILKAGGAYVPIDPAYPQHRIAYIVENSGIKILLTQSYLLERTFSQQTITILCLDRDWLEVSSYSYVDSVSIVNTLNLAYVVYTSGSTGKPKGVAVSHLGILLLCLWHQKEFGLTPESKATQLAAIGFDAMAWEVWPYLISCGTLNLVSKNTVLQPETLISYLYKNKITHSFVPTPVAENLVDKVWPKNIKLVYLLTGGDKFSVSYLNNLPFKLVNNYGPTESTVVTTSGKIQPSEKLVPSIGKPIYNISTYILDKELQPVSAGITGELYISGECLARGYLGKSDLTAEKFIPNPFSKQIGTRLYKTEDLARYDINGNINYVGRKDFQIKIRGFRIELGEIESVLVKQPGVREVVVMVHKRGEYASSNCLVAYVVCEKNQSVKQEDLRNALKIQLPEYMIPSFYIFLDNLPLTPNGKINRKILPIPDEDALLINKYVAPRTEMEEKLVNIWADILGLPFNKIGVNDNFFDIGGNSLLVTRVAVKIKNIFNVTIQIRELFISNTVEFQSAIVCEKIRFLGVVENLMNKGKKSVCADVEEIRI